MVFLLFCIHLLFFYVLKSSGDRNLEDLSDHVSIPARIYSKVLKNAEPASCVISFRALNNVQCFTGRFLSV